MFLFYVEDVAKKEDDKLEQQRALATLGHIYLTSYLDIPDNPDKSGLMLASGIFKNSLNICERYYMFLFNFKN